MPSKCPTCRTLRAALEMLPRYRSVPDGIGRNRLRKDDSGPLVQWSDIAILLAASSPKETD